MGFDTINDDVTRSGPATMLAGRYRVIRQLGQGGMGSVWLAEDTKLDNRQVAVKMLPSVLVSNKRAYNQLKAEALVSLKLTHPNIAAVRAFEENDGNPFLVIDYIDGLTLDDYLAKKGKLDEETTYCLLEPVARALDYAHEKGVVHRDVKPGNVMVTWDGDPYVLDFGIAREIQETMTRVTGKLSSGTLLYMSPEQLKGASPKPAQDVYSFAALVYECLTGEPPFSRGQVEWQILNDSPEPLPADVRMAPRVMAGLAKDPSDRPSCCRSVLKVGPVSAQKPVMETPSSASAAARTEPTVKTSAAAPAPESPIVSAIRDRRKPLAAVGALLAVVLAFAAVRNSLTTPQTSDAETVEDSGFAVKPAGLDEKYVETGVLVGRVERLNREEGFAAKIEALVDLQNRARSNYELQKWTAAEKLFDEAKAAAKEALAEAERRKIPTLKLSARVDGREVSGARIRFNGKEYDTPVSLGVVRKGETFGPFVFSYTENYRLYEGSFAAFKVDWEGLKTQAFDLKEHLFPKPGTCKVVAIDDSGVQMNFRWCPAGEFTMGSPADERGRYADETQHLVKHMRGFWMGETEVTQGQWKRLMDGATILDQARRALNDDTLYDLKGKRQTLRDAWGSARDADAMSRCGDLNDSVPLYYVNWNEAVEFCRRLTAREKAAKRLPDGYEYRLPTEAEWEYACRAGISTALPNGRDFAPVGKSNAPELDEIAWYSGNSSQGFEGRGWDTDAWEDKQYPGGRAAPREVRGRTANVWHLYDMLGNVAEWCGDWYWTPLPDGVDPTSRPNGRFRVVKGGAWDMYVRFCRPASRCRCEGTLRLSRIGFRVALAQVHADYPYNASEYKPDPLPTFRARTEPPAPQTKEERVAEAVEKLKQEEITIEEPVWFEAPVGIRFCRHCGAPVPSYLQQRDMCARCGKSLLPE